MKKIFFLFISLILIYTNLSGQANIQVEARSFYNVEDNKVYLRCAPKNYLGWKKIRESSSSIRIVRFHIEEGNGNGRTKDEILASQIEIGSVKEALPGFWEEKLDQLDTDENFGVYASVAFGDSLGLIEQNVKTIWDVQSAVTEQETRFSFAMMSCDNNFEVAEMAGFGYRTVQDLSPGKYAYHFFLGDEWLGGTELIRVVDNEEQMERQLPNIPSPMTYNMEGKKAMVFMDGTDLARFYTSYLFERNLDGSNQWVLVDSLPKVCNYDEEKQCRILVIDSFPNNVESFRYRIIGKNLFGFQTVSEPSELIKGYETLSVTAPEILNITEDANGANTIQWKFDVADESKISHFQILNSSYIGGTYDTIGTAEKNQRTFSYEFPKRFSYYRINALLLDSTSNSSMPIVMINTDTIPPLAPEDLKGRCNDEGVVILSWKRSLSNDVKGYKVLFSTQGLADSSFNEITPGYTSDTTHRFTVDLNTLTREMWFKVAALDFREMTSPYTEAIKVLRYDIIGPVAPIIKEYLPINKGVRFSFEKDEINEDLSHFEFQRKLYNTSSWETVDIFPKGQMRDNFTYTDSIYYHKPANRYMDRKLHEYRLIAKDSSGNLSSSNVVVIKPLDSGIRDSIQAFDVTFLPNGLNSIYFDPLVKIDWQYAGDIDLDGFQVFRGFDSLTLRPLRFYNMDDLPLGSAAPLSPLVAFDENVNKIGQISQRKNFPSYINGQSLSAVLPPSTTTITSPSAANIYTSNAPNTLKQNPNGTYTIYYAVQAIFKDGAMSPRTEIKSVTF
jgi:uncharacterized protein